jgi:hypothetical protein
LSKKRTIPADFEFDAECRHNPMPEEIRGV